MACHRLTCMQLRRRQAQGLADTEHCCKRPQAAEVYALQQLQWAGSLDPWVGQCSGLCNRLQQRYGCRSYSQPVLWCP